jgi:sulfoxide reductase heme-binding subunit YedZ
MVLKKEVGFFALIAAYAIEVSIAAFLFTHTDPTLLLIRLLALNGYIALSIAAIMTPFLKEITLFFKKPFTKIHHYFAAVGLVLITLHPLTYAFLFATPSVLLPNFDSIYLFFYWGGSVALITIYVAFMSVLLRRKITAYWRSFHALMYVALFFGVVHSNLLGQDLLNFVPIRIAYDGLFAGAILAFALKRWQFHKIKARSRKLHANQKTA